MRRPGLLLALALGFLGALSGPGVAEEPARVVWRDYALAATLAGHTSLVRCIGFSPDGTRLATGGSDRALRLWDPATGKPLTEHVLPRSG